jgi:hypothetical protein
MYPRRRRRRASGKSHAFCCSHEGRAGCPIPRILKGYTDVPPPPQVASERQKSRLLLLARGSGRMPDPENKQVKNVQDGRPRCVSGCCQRCWESDHEQ